MYKVDGLMEGMEGMADGTMGEGSEARLDI
jgi:hypothetical protein